MAVTLLSLLAAFLFGLALVLTQIGLRGHSPLAGVRISVPTAAACFVLLAPLTVDPAQWDTASAALFALVGVLFPAVVSLLTFEANRRIGPNLTGALGNLTPLFAVMIAAVLLREQPSVSQLAGIALIAVGVGALFYDPRSPVGQITAVSVMLPLAAALIRGLAQPAIKLGMEGWPNPFAAAVIGYVVSAVVVTGAAGLADRRAPNPPRIRNSRMWFAAVGLCNGSAALCMYAALGRGSVASVAPLVACYPLATLALGRIILGRTSLSPGMALGVAVTVAGVLLLIVF